MLSAINERDPEADGDTVVGGYLPSTVDHCEDNLLPLGCSDEQSGE